MKQPPPPPRPTPRPKKIPGSSHVSERAHLFCCGNKPTAKMSKNQRRQKKCKSPKNQPDKSKLAPDYFCNYKSKETKFCMTTALLKIGASARPPISKMSPLRENAFYLYRCRKDGSYAAKGKTRPHPPQSKNNHACAHVQGFKF